MSSDELPLPGSVAIAGAWGYIGRKFLDVALARGLRTYVFDPGPAPADVDLSRVTRVEEEAAFYRLDAELFHLATHPEYRRTDLLLARSDPPLVLNEKPMAQPERPEQCRQVIEQADRSRAVMFYDFPELFDPLTAWLFGFLGGFRRVELTGFYVQRSKDREDPALPRNYKRMVPIQYQEAVHCLAFVLHVLTVVRGSLDAALTGVRLAGDSKPYTPPNPDAYPYPVDGRVQYRADFGGVKVEGLTDFTRGAEWSKRRVVRGTGDGTPFEVDLSYLEGHKHLRVNGVEQPWDPASDSYLHVLATMARWARENDRDRLMTGPFPHPRFARATYQLSAALWRSSQDRAEVAFDTPAELAAFDARFAPNR
jgi:predicted dehydrogenase